MSENTYSTIKSSASKTKTPYSALRSNSATGTSATGTTRNTVSENTRLPTVKSATENLASTAKVTTKKIDSSVKDLKSTTQESVKSIEKTVTPVIKTVTEPVVKTAKTITNSVEKTVKDMVTTIENSPITKRFLGLFVIPLQKYGDSIITTMIILFGTILLYKEMNKDKPVEVEKKNMIGKIVYETFDGKSKPLPVEGQGNGLSEGFEGMKEKTECKPLPKGPVGGKSIKFCDEYNTEDHVCLQERCKDLGKNCVNASCCKGLCEEGFTLMGGDHLHGESDITYFSK